MILRVFMLMDCFAVLWAILNSSVQPSSIILLQKCVEEPFEEAVLAVESTEVTLRAFSRIGFGGRLSVGDRFGLLHCLNCRSGQLEHSAVPLPFFRKCRVLPEEADNDRSWKGYFSFDRSLYPVIAYWLLFDPLG